MRHFMLGTEDDFQLAGIRAYNDWLAKDFCAKAPERLVGIAQMPSVGVDAAITEMKRARAMGLRGVLFSAWPSGNLNLSDADDPFFAAAERLGMPISIHCGLAARAKVAPKPRTPVEEKAARGEGTGGRQVSALSGAGLDTMPLLMGEVILTRGDDRVPGPTVVSVEAGGGWGPDVAGEMGRRDGPTQECGEGQPRRRP